MAKKDEAQTEPQEQPPVKADVPEGLTFQADKDIHPKGEWDKQADNTSYPVPNDAELEDPPARTTRPDVPIVTASATGAGEHVPPDPKLYTQEGKPRLEESQS